MSKQREALEIALEAMEDHAKQYPHMQKGYTLDAIEALREALAEPEKANQCGETCERAKLCAVCANGLAEPEPEPVARVKTVGGYPDASEHTVEWLVKFKDVMSGQLLYAAPPARKPLTDTEIDALFNSQAWVSVVFFDAYGKPLERASSRDFARAVERAHGIGD